MLTNPRVLLSVCLVVLALLLVVLPGTVSDSHQLSPKEFIEQTSISLHAIDIDRAARYINNNDTLVQFIDLRSKEDFITSSLPGAINIPFNELMDKRWQGYLNGSEKTNVLFTHNEQKSYLASALLANKGFLNNIPLKGGFSKWVETILNFKYNGEALSARENAIYENRLMAQKAYSEYQNLPDSLKNTFLEAKLLEEEELDGGCE